VILPYRLSTLDLARTSEVYEGVLSTTPVGRRYDKVKEGGRLRHIFLDVGRDQLIAFLEPQLALSVPADYDADINRRLGVPAAFIILLFEAGSASALVEKPDELHAKGVEVTDIVDHGWAQSIYFKDPNGPSLEYCCKVRNLTEDDATMQERAFHDPNRALELDVTLSSKEPEPNREVISAMPRLIPAAKVSAVSAHR